MCFIAGLIVTKPLREFGLLTARNAAKNWTVPIKDRKPALNRFTIESGERTAAYPYQTDGRLHRIIYRLELQA